MDDRKIYKVTLQHPNGDTAIVRVSGSSEAQVEKNALYWDPDDNEWHKPGDKGMVITKIEEESPRAETIPAEELVDSNKLQEIRELVKSEIKNVATVKKRVEDGTRTWSRYRLLDERIPEEIARFNTHISSLQRILDKIDEVPNEVKKDQEDSNER